MPDDDDIDLDDWIAMSDAEQDRELASAMNQYNEMIDRMSRDEYLAYRRRRNLDLCLQIRKSLRAFPGLVIFQNNLRATQRRLLMLRMERAGVPMGNA